MAKTTYPRKGKEALPVVALCYDFDKTLSPDDMQAQGYIQSVGCDVKEFWEASNALARENDMDQNLDYMYKMIQEAEGQLVFNQRALEEYGAKVALFPGVREWFERIRAYGREKGVMVEHYIISSGLKEMIEGTEMAKAGAFEKVYASAFYYNDRGVAKWPAQVINYTNKTQFLFRISKGVLDINDPGVNDSFAPEEIRIPFRNMVYIGDSDTDIPCMKLVTSYGGHSIGVYDPDTGDKTKVYKMIRDRRIKFFAPADYREGTQLDGLVKAIIDRTVSNESLEDLCSRCRQEVAEAEKQDPRTAEDREKDELIDALRRSRNFSETHSLIGKLAIHRDWSEQQREKLFSAALKNAQVRWLLRDEDVRGFYTMLLECTEVLSKRGEKIREMLER